MTIREFFYLSGIISICILASSCNNQQQKDEQQNTQIEEDAEESKRGESSQQHPGAAVYTQNCSVCHQADGSGVSGLYPPLINTDWINGDESRLISLVLNGLSGPIKVNGENYNNVMPQFSYLDDEQIADLLTYLRGSFENNSGEITAQAVADVRASGT